MRPQGFLTQFFTSSHPKGGIQDRGSRKKRTFLWPPWVQKTYDTYFRRSGKLYINIQSESFAYGISCIAVMYVMHECLTHSVYEKKKCEFKTFFLLASQKAYIWVSFIMECIPKFVFTMRTNNREKVGDLDTFFRKWLQYPAYPVPLCIKSYFIWNIREFVLTKRTNNRE